MIFNHFTDTQRLFPLESQSVRPELHTSNKLEELLTEKSFPRPTAKRLLVWQKQY